MHNLPVWASEDSDGSWSIGVGDLPCHVGLERAEAEWCVTRLPQEVVAGTPNEHHLRHRRAARERIAGILNVSPTQVETALGVVKKSADGWGFGLYDQDHRYWFRTEVAIRVPRPVVSGDQDPDWIQTGGIPVVTDKTLVWIGLNPSTSDDDPTASRVTLSKVLRWAHHLGLPEVLGVNLFAYRHTDTATLRKAVLSGDVNRAVGDHNQQVLDHVLSGRGTVLAAWGRYGSLLGRGDVVRGQIRHGLCLGLCANGQPRHPARLAQATPLIPLQRS